jgi:hypothetical protein
MHIWTYDNIILTHNRYSHANSHHLKHYVRLWILCSIVIHSCVKKHTGKQAQTHAYTHIHTCSICLVAFFTMDRAWICSMHASKTMERALKFSHAWVARTRYTVVPMHTPFSPFPPGPTEPYAETNNLLPIMLRLRNLNYCVRCPNVYLKPLAKRHNEWLANLVQVWGCGHAHWGETSKLKHYVLGRNRWISTNPNQVGDWPIQLIIKISRNSGNRSQGVACSRYGVWSDRFSCLFPVSLVRVPSTRSLSQYPCPKLMLQHI